MNLTKTTLAIIVALLLNLSNIAFSATITVNSEQDAELPENNGDCTLREAIKAAEDNIAVDACAAGSGADTIIFASSVSNVMIDSGDLSGSSNTISESLSINGSGSDRLTIDGNVNHALFYFDSPAEDQTFSISGVTLYQANLPVYVHGGETVNIDDVVFEANSNSSGAAIFMRSSKALDNGRTKVSISNSAFLENVSVGGGGGAIRSNPNTDLTITNSSFLGNTTASAGGAIYAPCAFGLDAGDCTLTIDQTTFSGNLADTRGGALSIGASSSNFNTVTISRSTITGNIADANQSSSIGHDGGGIHYDRNTSLSLTSSIVAGNTDNSLAGTNDHDDISGLGTNTPTNATLISNGQNLIGNNTDVVATFSEGAPNASNDYVGTSANKLDPMISPLSDNGGTSLSHLPLPGSMAIDNGACPGVASDQRGFANTETANRIVDMQAVVNGPGSDGCDIGSIEVGAMELETDSSCYVIKTAGGAASVFCL